MSASPIATTARTHALHFPALDRRIECREDESVFAAARRAGVRIVAACGGRGHCGSCLVRVVQGRVHRDGEGAHRSWVRACRVMPRSDLTLEVAPRSLAPVARADVHTGEAGQALPFDPALEAHEIRLVPATLQDRAGDHERVSLALGAAGIPRRRLSLAGDEPRGHALAQDAEVRLLDADALPRDAQALALDADPLALAALPMLLRAHDGQLQVRVRRAIDREPRRLCGFARPGAPLLGLAVDLGTTNAAAFLIDLASGARLASLGLENPQVAWGADLVSRVDAAMRETATARELQRLAVDVIGALAHDLCAAVGAGSADIADAVVCGNTAMQHLLLGWPVAQLGRAPFVAASLQAQDITTDRLGLALGSGTSMHLAPSIGGFVGGDHVCALLATEALWTQPGATLVMDIGTNTEISLVRQTEAGQTRIWSASCPSGPALEGGHVGSGMRAAEGAIERVAIEGGQLRLGVIGGGRPVGLCGSGVLDALAAFVGAGWVDRRGRIQPVAPAVATVDGVRCITLAPAHEGRQRSIPAVSFDQRDVRAVQLAKSAIRTGVRLLADEAGITEPQIDRLVIAGAFGAYLSLHSALAIGLLPPLPADRLCQVGNAAGAGVQQMLSSLARRRRAAEIAGLCRYVELGSRRDFQQTFLHHIGFDS